MKFFAVGFDFKTASLELRVKAFSKDAGFLNAVAPEAPERLLISTCNRCEVYVLDNKDDPTRMVERWAKACELNGQESESFRVYQDQAAIAHLFRVAAGMESMVVGEAQIGGQVKRAYDAAVSQGSVGTNFHRVFQSAFKVAKKVRTQTEVGRLAVSIPSVAVKLAEKVLGDLSQKTVGIIGLGEIGKLAAEHFGSVQPKKLFLFNRTRSVAEDIHAELQTEGVQSEVVDSMDRILEEASVIVSAVDALLIKEANLKSLDRRGVPLTVLDLSVPPSVERCELEDIYLYGVDDLQKIAQENGRLRAQEVEKAEEIILEEAEKAWQSLRASSISDTFSRLASKVETMTQTELQLLKARLGHLSPEDWAQIEKMAFRLTSKVVQDPMMELKTQVQSGGEIESLIQFFRNIFRI